MCFYGSSIAHNADFDRIRQATGCRVLTRKAYASVKNLSSKYPEQNFTDVVDNDVVAKSGSVVVLQSSSVDIKNIDLSKPKEECFEEARQSSRNMYKVAINVSQLKSTKLVCLMKRTPRIDSAALASLSNAAND